MQSKIFSYPLIIKEQHLDTFGHVNNATYLSLFEEARWDLVTNNGYGLKKIRESGLGPTILEIKIVFLKELLLRDQITIETQLLAYERKIGKLQQKMIRNGEACCQADIVIGLFDLKTRKLITPTSEWMGAFGITE